MRRRNFYREAPKAPAAAPPPAPVVRRVGFCIKCGKRIGRGLWIHEKNCKNAPV
jgi:hypothetical protein